MSRNLTRRAFRMAEMKFIAANIIGIAYRNKMVIASRQPLVLLSPMKIITETPNDIVL